MSSNWKRCLNLNSGKRLESSSILYSLASKRNSGLGKIQTMKAINMRKETAKILKITFVDRSNGESETKIKIQTNSAIMTGVNLKKQPRANKRLRSTLFVA